MEEVDEVKTFNFSSPRIFGLLDFSAWHKNDETDLFFRVGKRDDDSFDYSDADWWNPDFWDGLEVVSEFQTFQVFVIDLPTDWTLTIEEGYYPARRLVNYIQKFGALDSVVCINHNRSISTNETDEWDPSVRKLHDLLKQEGFFQQYKIQLHQKYLKHGLLYCRRNTHICLSSMIPFYLPYENIHCLENGVLASFEKDDRSSIVSFRTVADIVINLLSARYQPASIILLSEYQETWVQETKNTLSRMTNSIRSMEMPDEEKRSMLQLLREHASNIHLSTRVVLEKFLEVMGSYKPSSSSSVPFLRPSQFDEI